MIESTEFEIDGYTYQVSQLGAKRGRKLLARLTRVMGPVIGAILEGGKNPLTAASDGGLEVSGDDLSRGLQELAGRLREEDLDYLCDTLAEQTVVVGQGPLARIFEAHFAGRYGAMFRWIGRSLQHNYSDFFAALGNVSPAPAPVDQGASQSQSLETSTG